MGEKKTLQKCIAIMLSVVMIVGLMLVSAMAETGSLTLSDSGEIISFEELTSEITAQSVPLGTSQSELNLPETIVAAVYYASAPEAGEFGQEEQQDTDGTDPSQPVTMNIPVTWTASPEYDGDTADKCLFTPELPEGFTLTDGVSLPAITVMVEQAAAYGEITSFNALADEIRWQNTASPSLPEAVSGTVAGEAADIPVTWEADHEYNADSPAKGLYVFTAKAGTGYTIADGVETPRITVYIPAAQRRLFRMTGAGTFDSALEITTADQLAEIATLVNAGKLETFLFNNSEATVYLTLGNDIDLSAYGEGWNGGKGWVPIGMNPNAFKATFDGNGNTITGLYINDSGLFFAGLFGRVTQGTVKNLGLTGANISAKIFVGGLAGSVEGGSVENCYVTGNVTANDLYAGGVVGYMNKAGSVENCCFTTGNVAGTEYVGGVVGCVFGGSVENCYATGNVTGTGWYVGGVVGNVDRGSVTNCAALNPSVSSKGYVGRVAGYLNPGTLSGNCAFSGMKVMKDNSPKSITSDAAGVDGADMGAAAIKGDGTLGGRLTIENGWTVGNGKLPGIGETVDMPDHIVDGSDPNFRGNGTLENPYQIGTAAQLAKLAELINAGDTSYNSGTKYYKLTADIDLSGYNASNTGFNEGKGWVPIGTVSNPFRAAFNGNGNTITGLYINNSDLAYVGLFGYVQKLPATVYDARVENLGLTGANITGNLYVGGVAGCVSGVGVKNSYVIGNVTGAEYVGGVVGSMYIGSVINCYVNGNVNGDYRYAGGVAGYVENGDIRNSYVTGNVTGIDGYVGGVAGYAYTYYVINCAALNQSVSGSGDVGRVAGQNNGALIGNCAFSGMTGGGSNKTANGLDGADKDAAAIAGAGFFQNLFGGNSAWIYADGKLPILAGFAEGTQDPTIPYYIGNRYFGGGDGSSEAQAYEISTAAQLAKLSELVNGGDTSYNAKYYKLAANIDLSGYNTSNTGFNGGRGWVPIGTASNPFMGTFDGNGNTITGLYINNSGLDYAGLFGYVFGGTVKNLGLTGANIIGKRYVGGVAGCVARGFTIGGVENSYVSGTVTGFDSHVGGVVGRVNSLSVKNCYFTGKVTGIDYVGGVTGTVFDVGSSVKNCYSTGPVSGSSYVGGVAGAVAKGSVTNCAALNPSVSGSNCVRRVAGYLDSGILSGNNAFSGMTGGGSDKTANGLDGADITVSQMNTAAFWTGVDNWDTSGWDTAVWTIQDGELPVLKNMGGVQSGDGGLYLTERDIRYAATTLSENTYTYDGAAKTPVPTVTFDSATLTQDTDYTVTYSDNIDAGTAFIEFTGKGNFSGTKSVTYTINKAPAPTLSWPAAESITYGDTLSDSALTGGSTTYGSFAWTNGDTVPTAGSGGYSVTFTPNAATAANYEAITETTKTVAITVNKGIVPPLSPQTVSIYRGAASNGNTVNLAALLPADRGTTSYSVTSTNSLVQNVSVNASGTLSFDTLSSDSVTTENVTVKAEMQNYEDAVLTVTVNIVDKKVPVVTPSASGTLSYGQPLSTLTINATALEDDGSTPVFGSIAWNNPTGKPIVGAPAQGWTFTPTDTTTYEIVTGTAAITVNKADPQGTPAITQISTGGKVLSDAALTGSFKNPFDGSSVPGTLGWNLPDTTAVTHGTAYSWTFTPENIANYGVRTGSLTPYPGSPGGGSSSGGSSDSDLPTITTMITPGKSPDQPITASVPLTATMDSKGTANAVLPDKVIADAIAKAQAEAKAQGKTTDNISLALNIAAPKGITAISATLSQNALKALVDAGVSSLEINGLPVSVSFDQKALQAIRSQSSGDVTITAVSSQDLSDDAKALIGARPVYNITVGYTKNGSSSTVGNLDGGTATVSIPYTPANGESPDCLYAVYVDGEGNATRIDGSAYDANSGRLIFTTGHLSIYGVGYTAPSAKFTDTSKHWAVDSIDCVVGRGLLAGTSGTTFSPDKAMTRGMLVTALGRLAGADVSGYQTSSFTDVEAGSYYLPYIEWAYKKVIIQGISNSQFAPDRAVTRQEIAAIFANYAKATGYSLPATRPAVTYADSGSIDSIYKKAITVMQQAGIMLGRNNNRFDPKAGATRAEVSAMLYRYIKLILDPATSQGWVKNDGGQGMYYKDGKALIGWQTIDGKIYCFDSYGGAYANSWRQNNKGEWFYLTADGSAARGWKDIDSHRYYFGTDAVMTAEKWLEIDGKRYYFCADGSLR